MKFVNLYLQTEYSLLASTLKLNHLISKAKEYGYEALGIADHNNMHGVVKFYSKCVENNIKPIIGLHLDVASDFSYLNSLLLYAKNNNGYRNLLKISSIKNTVNKDLKIEDLYNYLNDLIVIIPNEEHELVKSYLEGSFENFNSILNKYLKIKYIENCDLYLGLDLQSNGAKYSLDDLIYLSKQKGIKNVALHKSAFFELDDYDVYKIIRCVALNAKEYNGSEKERNSYFISPTRAVDLFRKYPDLVSETIEIANNCNVSIDFGNYHMPVYLFDKECSSKDYLHDLAVVGLKKRLIDNKIEKSEYHKYLHRLQYELDVICKMGFADYFLIVYDFIKYAKNNNILVGPGRGSGPGSLVAYSLGITEINPLEFDLLFERFLNPYRVSMPDIDTDFPDDRREDVIKYMGTRYGKSRVAHICTFGTYGPRLAIRDVARVINLKPLYLDSIIENVPNDANSITEVLETNLNFKRLVESNETIKFVVKMAKKLENLPRNLSVHAAGIIMADKDLDNYTPLSEGINGLYQTQFEASDLEKLGLIKIDFLGIRNLTIITKVLKLMNINDKDINQIYRIPLNDSKTLQMLASGNTDGIFQLESGGMRKTLMQLKTNSFIDIVDAIALYRPGPMEMIPTFVNRKLNKEEIVYPHQDLEGILKPTYGIIVYQEQILQIASLFAGYSLGEADILRRAVSKKKVDELKQQEEKFIQGAIKKGYKKEVAKNIFDLILKFANYGFNKSHSVAYSYISYQMAYLKTHYYKEFMAVLMSYSIGRTNAIKNYIMECNQNKVEVVLPSVNYSSSNFNIVNGKIYYSLMGINGLGEVVVNEIVKERTQNGLYQSYDDFIARTKGFLNRKVVEALIYAGACDEFKITRKAMIEEYEQSLELANFGGLFKDQLVNHQFSNEEFTFEVIANFERFALGFNFKFDIFKQYGYLKKKFRTTDICKLVPGKKAFVMFMVDRIKVIKTKKGEEMVFLNVSDDTSPIDATCFPKTYAMYKNSIAIGKICVAECNVENRDEKIKIVIEKMFFQDK
ncbi:MAG: DNA polymerase III subunit alpha [Bacilli bacterium]|nr:DNA polymerase III subunit alpha [Bacilli bacterium]